MQTARVNVDILTSDVTKTRYMYTGLHEADVSNLVQASVYKI